MYIFFLSHTVKRTLRDRSVTASPSAKVGTKAYQDQSGMKVPFF